MSDEQSEPDEPEAEDAEADVEADAEDAEPESAEAQGERRLRDLAAALHELDDASISRGVATMREQSRGEVAQALQMSKASMHLGEALAPLLRRKVLTVPPTRQLSVAFALVEEVNDETIALLGENSENPSRADLDAAVPALIESQGLPIVRLMVAAYAASDARCQAVMGELRDDDERFALPDPPAPEDLQADEPTGITTVTRATDDPAQAEKRAQRKAAKAAKREAEARKKAAAEAAQAARKQAQHDANQSRANQSRARRS